MEHPLDEEGTELLAGQCPAPHPAAGLPGRPAQQVRLPGLLCCGGRDGSGSGPGTAGGEGQGFMSGNVPGGRCAGRVVSPTLVGMGCCMQGCNGSPPDPPSPQLLPRRGPWTQCKGEERRVIATPMSAQPGLALTQGRAGSPNNHSPPTHCHGCPHTSSICRRGLSTFPGISCPIPSPAQSQAPPNQPLSPLLALPDTEAKRERCRTSIPEPPPARYLPKGMRVRRDASLDGHVPGWTHAKAPAPAHGVEVGGTSGRGWPAQGVLGLSSPPPYPAPRRPLLHLLPRRGLLLSWCLTKRG